MSEDDFKSFTLTECKPQLAKLIQQAESGEQIAITNHGTPAVFLVPAMAYVAMRDAWLQKATLAQDVKRLASEIEELKGLMGN